MSSLFSLFPLFSFVFSSFHLCCPSPMKHHRKMVTSQVFHTHTPHSRSLHLLPCAPFPRCSTRPNRLSLHRSASHTNSRLCSTNHLSRCLSRREKTGKNDRSTHASLPSKDECTVDQQHIWHYTGNVCIIK